MRRKFTGYGLLMTLATLAGCGSDESVEDVDSVSLVDRFDEDRRRHDPVKFIEVELGNFFVSHRHDAEDELKYVRFHVFAVIPEDELEPLTVALGARGNRLRDRVIEVIQKTETSHLHDPALGVIKSELIPSVNRVLQTRVVRDIVFTQFAVEGL